MWEASDKNIVRRTIRLKTKEKIVLNLLARAKGYKLDINSLTMEPLPTKKLPLQDIDYILGSIGQYPTDSQIIINIDASYHRVKSAPRSLEYFSNLLALNLSHNCLTHVNIDLCALRQLERIDLSYNKLKALPKKLPILLNLKHINMQDNQISCAEKGIYALIDIVDFRDNPVYKSLSHNQMKTNYHEEMGNIFKEITKGTFDLNQYLNAQSNMVKKINLYSLMRSITHHECDRYEYRLLRHQVVKFIKEHDKYGIKGLEKEFLIFSRTGSNKRRVSVFNKKTEPMGTPVCNSPIERFQHCDFPESDENKFNDDIKDNTDSRSISPATTLECCKSPESTKSNLESLENKTNTNYKSSPNSPELPNVRRGSGVSTIASGEITRPSSSRNLSFTESLDPPIIPQPRLEQQTQEECNIQVINSEGQQLLLGRWSDHLKAQAHGQALLNQARDILLDNHTENKLSIDTDTEEIPEEILENTDNNSEFSDEIPEDIVEFDDEPPRAVAIIKKRVFSRGRSF